MMWYKKCQIMMICTFFYFVIVTKYDSCGTWSCMSCRNDSQWPYRYHKTFFKDGIHVVTRNESMYPSPHPILNTFLQSLNQSLSLCLMYKSQSEISRRWIKKLWSAPSKLNDKVFFCVSLIFYCCWRWRRNFFFRAGCQMKYGIYQCKWFILYIRYHQYYLLLLFIYYCKSKTRDGHEWM